MKIGIGTAQFGVKYGITNRSGQVGEDEAARILRHAADRGIDLVDTAAAYGESESVIGRLLWHGHPFRIVSKVPPLAAQGQDGGRAARVYEACRESLLRLRQESLYALLLHQVADLASADAPAVLGALTRAKREGLVQKIGVSVYTGDEIDRVLDLFTPDVVQIPVNALAQRLVRSGHVARLRAAGVEIHARSVFLQGVLLAEPRALPGYFSPYAAVLERFHRVARTLRASPLRLALNYVAELDEIHASIVGVTTVAELEEILDARSPLDEHPDWSGLACADEQLTNPARWPKGLA